MRKPKITKTPAQRRILLLAPVLMFPFLTLFFWALGGGSTIPTTSSKAEKKFNVQLPGALPEKQVLDKMHYYDLADKDSLERSAAQSKDPSYKKATRDTLADTLKNSSSLLVRSLHTSQEQPEQQVFRKLEKLQREINRSSEKALRTPRPVELRESRPATSESDRLEALMASLNTPPSADPEMEQLNGMLENILDLQYPERVEEKLRKASQAERGQVFPVAGQRTDAPISLFEPRADSTQLVTHMPQNGFFGLDYNPLEAQPANTVRAEIYQSQSATNGSVIKLRLCEAVYVNGIRIPKNQFVYGTASIKGERMQVSITGLQYDNSIYPVDMAVFDIDGLQGVYIPGAIVREVAKNSTDRSMQGVGLTTLDDSWKAQAAGAGIEAAKGLFSKKVKLIRVKLKAGYKVLLRNEKQKEN